MDGENIREMHNEITRGFLRGFLRQHPTSYAIFGRLALVQTPSELLSVEHSTWRRVKSFSLRER